MAKWRTIRRELLTKKVIRADDSSDRLNRCLSVTDLTALGVGSTLGVGVYVLVGLAAQRVAGPSVVLSFLVAALASMVSGLCYAELSARMPQAGSAYIYTYISMGEIFAFIVGWNMLLDYLFGTASVARGLSLYIDALTGKAISAWFASFAPLAGHYLCDYYDFLAFALILVMGGLLAVGIKISSMVNNLFTSVNVVVIIFVIIAGAFKADPENWRLAAAAVPAGAGAGGFFPFGVAGTMRGAAICFYGFVGFETICHISEEAKCPRRSVPLAILLVLVIVLLAYCGVAVVLTMMLPYYLQDKDASVSEAFKAVGWSWAQWPVAAGAAAGMLASMFGALLPASRLVFALAADGLVPRALARVPAATDAPLPATLLVAAVVAVLAGLLDLQQILMMMSFGTLLSYSIVAAEVLVLRYKSKALPSSPLSVTQRVFGVGLKAPTRPNYTSVLVALTLFSVTCLVSAVVWVHVWLGAAWLGALHAAAALLVAAMAAHPQNDHLPHFKTPLVPLIPCISIYSNIHLMVLISYQTWIRNAIWLVFGIIIYTICSIKYKKNSRRHEDKIPIDKNDIMPPMHIAESVKQPNQSEVYENTDDDVIVKYSDFEDQTRQINSFGAAQAPEISKSEIVMLQAVVETNEEKEAKIIDLLDQVLQAEEDSYCDVLSSTIQNVDVNTTLTKNDDHRQSLGDISDAGSDASLGNQVLSKYDVVAQVHREDMPRLSEEEEKQYNDETEEQEINIQFDQGQDFEHNESEFNGSETNSQTDESGYSDTIYKTINNSTEDTTQENVPYIPIPPPLDESYFAKPAFRKSYSMISKSPKPQLKDFDDEIKPRESVQSAQSNGSLDDGHIVFGSDKQVNFMTKLNNLFQTKILSEGEEKRARSNSTGSVTENKQFTSFGRPAIFAELKKEIMSKDVSHNLRPVIIEIVDAPEDETNESVEEEKETDTSLNRSDLKSKLESIFANGGPQLIKPPQRKAVTPMATSETAASSPDSLPKIEKNDTLKRQRDKFGEVLNSFRLSVNRNDIV